MEVKAILFILVVCFSLYDTSLLHAVKDFVIAQKFPTKVTALVCWKIGNEMVFRQPVVKYVNFRGKSEILETINKCAHTKRNNKPIKIQLFYSGASAFSAGHGLRRVL